MILSLKKNLVKFLFFIDINIFFFKFIWNVCKQILAKSEKRGYRPDFFFVKFQYHILEFGNYDE